MRGAGILCGAALALAAASAAALPYKPADDAVVLERLPGPREGEPGALRRLRAELTRDSGNLDLALKVATRYVRLARAEGDPRYNGYAQAALAPWWGLTRPPDPVLVLRATLRQNRHEFSAALADLDRILETGPGHAQARLTRAVILRVLGRLHESVETCAGLEGLAEPLVVVACVADAASLLGRAEASYGALAREFERRPSDDLAVRLWALTILAEIAARRGDTVAAERHFRAALAIGQRDVYLLGAYADFLLERGRAREASDLLADERRADPLLLRLALAESALGGDAAGLVGILDARFEASRRRGDRVHLREEARHLLNLKANGEEALRLALENWQVQREPADARLVLEAALAAAAPAAASEVAQWVRSNGLEDDRIAALIARLPAARP